MQSRNSRKRSLPSENLELNHVTHYIIFNLNKYLSDNITEVGLFLRTHPESFTSSLNELVTSLLEKIKEKFLVRENRAFYMNNKALTTEESAKVIDRVFRSYCLNFIFQFIEVHTHGQIAIGELQEERARNERIDSHIELKPVVAGTQTTTRTVSTLLNTMNQQNAETQSPISQVNLDELEPERLRDILPSSSRPSSPTLFAQINAITSAGLPEDLERISLLQVINSGNRNPSPM